MKNKKDDIFDLKKHLQKIIFNIYRFIPQCGNHILIPLNI